MRFGKRIRELRAANGFSLRELGEKTGINFTYISRIETGKLALSEFPGEATIHKLADALDADEEELLLMARKIPDVIKDRVFERPEVFRRLARLDDGALDKLLANIDE
ncbi:helix-turn-helix domain-containing protein [Rhodopirellula baltica]